MENLENSLELKKAYSKLKKQKFLLKYFRTVFNFIMITYYSFWFYKIYAVPEQKVLFYILLLIVVPFTIFFDFKILKRDERRRYTKINELIQEIQNLNKK